MNDTLENFQCIPMANWVSFICGFNESNFIFEYYFVALLHYTTVSIGLFIFWLTEFEISIVVNCNSVHSDMF